MPYIEQKDRKRYDTIILNLAVALSEIPEEDRDGHINYCITKLFKALYAPPKYKRYNRAIGVLECIKLEFYRRIIALYEDKKIKENNDV